MAERALRLLHALPEQRFHHRLSLARLAAALVHLAELEATGRAGTICGVENGRLAEVLPILRANPAIGRAAVAELGISQQEVDKRVAGRCGWAGR